MSATEELRRMLDERGMEYARNGCEVFFVVNDKPTHIWAIDDEELCASIAGLTPEQAIAATLGNGECTPHGEWKSITQTQEVRHVFCDCGYELGMDERDSWPFKSTRLFAMPNYCQECGRKIRKAVKR